MFGFGGHDDIHLSANLGRTRYLPSWISEDLGASFYCSRHNAADPNVSAVADSVLIDDRSVGPDPNVGTNRHAATDDGASGNLRARPNSNIMRDMNEIINLHEIANNGVVQGCSRDSAVATNLDEIANLDSTNMRKRHWFSIRVKGKTEAGIANGGIRSHDAIRANLYAASNDDTATDSRTCTNLDLRPDHRPCSDIYAVINSSLSRHRRRFRHDIFLGRSKVFRQN